jgi:hypothetical protein
VFFLNVAPDKDTRADRFCDGGNAIVNAQLLKVMGEGGTPAVSAFEAIARFRPSAAAGDRRPRDRQFESREGGCAV